MVVDAGGGHGDENVGVELRAHIGTKLLISLIGRGRGHGSSSVVGGVLGMNGGTDCDDTMASTAGSPTTSTCDGDGAAVEDSLVTKHLIRVDFKQQGRELICRRSDMSNGQLTIA